MPIFLLQIRYDFNSGDMEYGTEKVPEDLLDDNGHMMSLAVWPQEPLRVEAADEESAFEIAKRKRAQDSTCYINTKIGEARFESLQKRPRPGGPPGFSSVILNWTSQEEGKSAEHLVAWEPVRIT